MQWAAVFHNQEFVAEDIPFELQLLHEKLLGHQENRSFATSIITAFSHVNMVQPVNCQRAWNAELQVLPADWKKCRRELKGWNTKAEIYHDIPHSRYSL